MKQAGYSSSYLDVAQTPLAMTVGNALATVPGVVVSIVGADVLALDGEWRPLLYSGAQTLGVSAIIFLVFASANARQSGILSPAYQIAPTPDADDAFYDEAGRGDGVEVHSSGGHDDSYDTYDTAGPVG